MTTTPSKTQNLRQRAEELFRTNEYFIPELTSPEETKLLFYELRVDQIQLEIQNEELRTLAALRDSEDRFKNMANTAPVLIWISGTDKLCHWFNQVWLDFTGRAMEQETGNGWTEGVHPDDLERCLETYVNAFDNRQPFSIAYRLRAANGQYRWLMNNGVPTYVEHAFTGYIGSCVDILPSANRRKRRYNCQKLRPNPPILPRVNSCRT